MIFTGQLTVGALDLILSRVTRDTHDLIIVFDCIVSSVAAMFICS